MLSTLIFAIIAGAVTSSPLVETYSLETREIGHAYPICKEKATPPAGDICYQSGVVNNASVLMYPSSDSAAACGNACGGTAKCVSWGYTSTVGCFLYNMTLSAMDFQNSNSSGTYADKTCSTCTPCTQDTFKNGGFESGKLTPWEVRRSVMTTGGHVNLVSPGSKRSKYAAHISAPASDEFYDGGIVSLVQSIKACQKQNYHVSFDYATTAYSSDDRDNSFSVISGREFIQVFPGPDSVNNYTTFRRIIPVFEDNSFTFTIEWHNFNTARPAGLLIDNVVFKPTS